MGLDSVELLMAVEDEFAIEFTDADAGGAETVGQLVDLIHARVAHSGGAFCPSQRGFQQVRSQLLVLLPLPRTAIRPDTPLDEIIPREGRAALWRTLLLALSGDAPSRHALILPHRLQRLVSLIFPAVAFLLSLLWLPAELFWLGLFVAIAVNQIGQRLTAQYRSEFPLGLTQVRDLIRLVTTLDERRWTHQQVFERLRAITVEQLGVDSEQVTLEARWVRDLGMD